MGAREEKRGSGRPQKRDATDPQVDAKGVRWSEDESDAWHEDWGGEDDLPADEEPLYDEEETPDPLETPDEEEEDEDEEAEASEAEAEADAESTPDDGGDDKRRGRRRSKTIARKQMLRERRKMIAQGVTPEVVDYERPRHRSQCREGERPCLFVSCRYHLYLDVNPVTGSIKLNFPDKEVWELAETCALDVAERGGITLEEVGEIMNLTRERIRQVEVSGLEMLKAGDESLQTFIDGKELDALPLIEKR
jgi:hypothetical protein